MGACNWCHDVGFVEKNVRRLPEPRTGFQDINEVVDSIDMDVEATRAFENDALWKLKCMYVGKRGQGRRGKRSEKRGRREYLYPSPQATTLAPGDIRNGGTQ